MTVQSWLAAATTDAERRGLAELKPLLATLARATEALRQAEAALDTREADPSSPQQS